MPLSHFQLAQPLETFCIPLAVYFHQQQYVQLTTIALWRGLGVRNSMRENSLGVRSDLGRFY
jgi:hypothetical protein